MASSIQQQRGPAFWVMRIYMFNAFAVAVGLAGLMVIFGILTASLVDGLMFPMAVFSMATEGSPWGIWMLSPLYLLPIAVVAQHLRRQGAALPRSK